jgi:hypothetical protein
MDPESAAAGTPKSTSRGGDHDHDSDENTSTSPPPGEVHDAESGGGGRAKMHALLSRGRGPAEPPKWWSRFALGLV